MLRAIETLICSQTDANVICLGFRKVQSGVIAYLQLLATSPICSVPDLFVCKQRRPSSKAQYVQGLHRTEAYYPNTTTKLLKGAAWQLLLSRIGDSIMLHLLMNASIFLLMANGCYLQVTGAPVTQVDLHYCKRASVVNFNLTTIQPGIL